MRCFIPGLVMLGFLVGITPLWAADDPADKMGEKVERIGDKTLDQWIAEILHQDPGVREKAIRTVPLFGPAARKAVKKLIVELNDNDPSLRTNAVMVLGDIGMNEEDLEKGVKALGRLLTTDSQAIIRFHAAVALMKLGRDAKEAIPQLVSAAKDTYTSWEVRRVAVMALATVALNRKEGPDPKAIRALITALKDNCLRVRQQALASMIVLGKPDDAALLQSEKTALLALMRDRDKLQSMWAHVAFMRIDKVEDKHLFAVSQLLKDPDPYIRTSAAQALQTIGPEAKSRIPELIERLDDKDLGVVTAVVAALVAIGDEAVQKAKPKLDRMAESENEALQALAKMAFDSLTKKDKPKKPDAKKAP